MVKQRIDLDEIMEHTALIVDEGGQEALSLGTLADRLGVQPSALYNHVNGVDGLWRDFAAHATNRLGDILLEAAVARSRGPALRAVAHAYRSFAHAHPGQFASCILPPASIDDSLGASHQRIVTMFHRVVASFDIPLEQQIHATRTVRAAIHGFVALEAIDGLPSPDSPDPSFDHLLQFLIDGLNN